MARFIVAFIRMNSYLDNLCHVDSSTGTTHAFCNKRYTFIKEFRKTSIFAEIFQTALEIQM